MERTHRNVYNQRTAQQQFTKELATGCDLRGYCQRGHRFLRYDPGHKFYQHWHRDGWWYQIRCGQLDHDGDSAVLNFQCGENWNPPPIAMTSATATPASAKLHSFAFVNQAAQEMTTKETLNPAANVTSTLKSFYVPSSLLLAPRPLSTEVTHVNTINTFLEKNRYHVFLGTLVLCSRN